LGANQRYVTGKI